MVILRSQNKITDFLMILAWASPFTKNIATCPTNAKLMLDRYDDTMLLQHQTSIGYKGPTLKIQKLC